MNIGIIGGGAIAAFLLEKVQSEEDLQVNSVFVRNQVKYEHLCDKYNVQLYTNIGDFLRSDIDIVVEAANVSAVEQLLPTIMKKKDVIVISVGAFVNEEFGDKVISIAESSKHNIYLPSGALGGLDLLQNAHALEEVTEVSLTTRKPANSLTKEILQSEKVIFSGSAKEAIKKFPKNINVSIILSLAGIGPEKTRVTVIADPKATKNEHTVELSGMFGTASFSVTNNPMENNSNTSYLAALSVLSMLKRSTQCIRIG